ncbi:MAG: glycosyl hydrolase [Bacteroidetes bacterium]|nr:MAG: glycosyl hydrolase [Bacteroidota bacterium]
MKRSYKFVLLIGLLLSQSGILLSQEGSKECPASDGYITLFDGTNLDAWTGNMESYRIEDGTLAVRPGDAGGGNLYTKDEFENFILHFEFKLTEGANNGLGIRTPLSGDAAYVGMELQILDNTAEVYKDLHCYQYHGSVYGVIPALRGFLKPVGEWNRQTVIADGTKIRVILNGHEIVNGDIGMYIREQRTVDRREHPGLGNKKGHIGFLGHGHVLWFRNIRIMELP